jgi:cell division protein FtsB
MVFKFIFKFIYLFIWQSNSLARVCKASAHEKYKNKEINMTF